MNEKIKRFLEKGGSRRSQAARQILLQYVLALLVLALALAFGCIFAWSFLSGIEWAPVWALRSWIRDNVLFIALLLVLAGWGCVTYYFFSKPLRYLDEIVAAAQKLAEPDAEPIRLPPAMKNVQDELNLVRERSLRNAMLAKEAEQRKNDLIVYLAHDLKTPLTSVIGYLTLLRDEPQISLQLRARYTDIALDKAERLEELINEFFDITRFNLTALSLEKEKRSLSRMLWQLVSEFEPILAEKELRWQTDIEKDVEILCDPDKLQRVFDNLIRNAVSYSYPGTEISLTMKRVRDSVEIRVINCGKTIPADKLERIFEQFFRLDSSRASSTGGAGLGLAIAKELTQLHGGSIGAESADGRTAFVVTLPAECHNFV